MIEVTITLEEHEARDRHYTYEVRTTRFFGLVVWVSRRWLPL